MTRQTQNPRPLVLGLSTLLLLVMVAAGSAAEARRVLLINSFGREFAPFDAFAGSFRTTLLRNSPHPLEFFEVYLDSSRFLESSEEGPLADYLQVMFKHRRPDLVVPIGGPAVRFAQTHREHLFPTTPLLMTAMDDRLLQQDRLTPQDAVVPVRNDPNRILDGILQVLPETTNVCVILGDSPLERFWLGVLQREFQPYTNRVGFEWMSDLPYDRMIDRCTRLPPRSAILYTLLAVDANGVSQTEQRSLADLHRTANAPIFGLYDTQLGRGIVGGRLMGIEDLSRTAAEAAAHMLEGEPPARFRLPPQIPKDPQFDWRELRRWSIREEALPEGSQILFRPARAWERNYTEILLVLAVCLVEAALIVALLSNLAARRRAERELLESLREVMNLRAAMDQHTIVSITDAQGRITYVNDKFCAISKYPHAELLGQNHRLINSGHHSKEFFQDMWSRIAHGQVWHGEIKSRAKDGSFYWVETTIVPFLNADGKPHQYVALRADVTARKQAQETAQELSRQLISAQEQERARLARELHDDITQRLARLAIDAASLERMFPEAAAIDQARSIRHELVRLSEDVHALSYRLHPSLLEDLGLSAALRVECERFQQRYSIPVVVRLSAVPEGLPQEVALGLFRILQEALRNVARHAHARTVEVSLRSLDGGLQLAIQDNGVGFDPVQERHSRPTLGMASMRERMRLLDGELDIDSTPGHGSTIQAWVPLKKDRA